MHTILVTVIVSVSLLLVVILAMSFKALFVKNGRFPDSHVCRHNFDHRKTNLKDYRSEGKAIE